MLKSTERRQAILSKNKMWLISHYRPFPQDNKDNSNTKTNTKLITYVQKHMFHVQNYFQLALPWLFLSRQPNLLCQNLCTNQVVPKCSVQKLIQCFWKGGSAPPANFNSFSSPISLSFVLCVSLSPQMQNGFWFQIFGWVGRGPWKIHGNYINTRLQWKLKCKREWRVNPCCVKEENKSQLCSRKVPTSKRWLIQTGALSAWNWDATRPEIFQCHFCRCKICIIRTLSV